MNFLISVPTPPSLPIIGHLHLMMKYPKKPWKVIDELSREYGEIYRLKLGQSEYVMITGVDATSEAVIKHGNSCLDRPIIATWDLIAKGQENSMHFASWSILHQDLRKGMIDRISACTLSKLTKLENLSWEATKKFILPKREKYSSFLIDDLISAYALMAVDYFCGVNFLGTVQKGDREWNSFCKAMVEVHDIAVAGHTVDVFPMLKSFKLLFPTLRRLDRSYSFVRNYVEHKIGMKTMKEQMQREAPSTKISDDDLSFAELLIKNHLDTPSSLSWDKSVGIISSVIANVMPAVYTTMLCFTHIAIDKSFQEKIYREIRKSKSQRKNGIISLKEAQKFALIRATISEVVRLTSPPYLPRLVTRDMMIRGYRIPKGTTIMANAYSFHHSTSIWESPEKFMPARFFNISKGTGSDEFEYTKPNHFYPYGMGRRSCPGYGLLENLAPQLIANLISQYKLDCDFDEEEISKRNLDNYESFRTRNSFCLRLEKRI